MTKKITITLLFDRVQLNQKITKILLFELLRFNPKNIKLDHVQFDQNITKTQVIDHHDVRKNHKVTKNPVI